MTARYGSENQAAHESSSGLAPVIPLFGSRENDNSDGESAPHRSVLRAQETREGTSNEDPFDSRATRQGPGPRRHESVVVIGGESEVEVDPEAVRNAAESLLLRKLRTRQLSTSEARTVIRQAGMAPDAAEDLLESFTRLGYLNDPALAEQLIHAAVTRKGQGRQAIKPLLVRRGIEREVVDATVAALPDDDLDRALEFARTKARSAGGRDRETALRRLLGQLGRRGYPAGVAMTAARQALDEL